MEEAFERELARVASDVAREAGEVIRARFAAPRSIGTKSGAIDLVTDTDRAADRLITGRLAAAFPWCGIVSEEGGAVGPMVASDGGAPGDLGPTDMPVQWIVDPLDGTTNFAHGFPHVAVSIAAVAGLDPRDPLGARSGPGARPIAGVIYDPMRDELFAATASGPATRNGEPIAVTAESRLDACLVATGFPYDRRERADFYLGFWRDVMVRCRDVRRAGAAALDLAWVACGRLDAFWEWHLHPWDVAAGALIVRRAGGRATDFRGATLLVEARQTLASNGRVHDPLLAVLRARLDADLAAPRGG